MEKYLVRVFNMGESSLPFLFSSSFPSLPHSSHSGNPASSFHQMLGNYIWVERVRQAGPNPTCFYVGQQNLIRELPGLYPIGLYRSNTGHVVGRVESVFATPSHLCSLLDQIIFDWPFYIFIWNKLLFFFFLNSNFLTCFCCFLNNVFMNKLDEWSLLLL